MLTYGVPDKFKGATVDSLPSDLANIVNPTESYFISGVVGGGKSYMMSAILRSYLISAKMLRYGEADSCFISPENKFFHFCTEYEIYENIKNSYNGKSPSEVDVMNKLSAVPLLAIDDFGTEPQKGDWSSSKMFAIIDRRYNRNKQTLITSNVSLQTISQDIDDRIASRISEMCTIVELTEKYEDRRVKKMKKFTF